MIRCIADTQRVLDVRQNPPTPIKPSADLLTKIEKTRTEFNTSVMTTFRSVGDYSQTSDPAMEPCCDVKHPECMCAG